MSEAKSFFEARRLIVGFFTYGLGDFVLFGLSYFVLIPALTHYMKPDEYGVVASITAVGILLSSIMQFGLPSTVMRYIFLYQPGPERSSYLGSLVLFGVALAAATSVLLTVAGAPLWDYFIHAAPFSVFGKYVVWGAFFQIPFIFASVLLRAHEQPRLFVAMNIGQFLCLTLMVVFHVVYLKQGALGQARAAFYTYALFGVLSSVLLTRYLSFRPRWQHVRDSLGFAGPVFITYLIGFFVTRANVLMLQYFAVGTAVGVFALGAQISNLIYMLSAAFEKVWQPFLYRLEADKGRLALAQYLRISAPFFILVVLVMSLFAPEVIAVISSSTYGGAWSVVAITGLGTTFVAISSVPSGGIYYARRSKLTAWITAAAAVVNVGLGLVMIPVFGMVGAAWTSLLVGLVTLLLNLWFMERLFPASVSYLNLLTTLALGGGCFVVGSLLGRLWPGASHPILVLGKVAAVAAYLWGLWELGIFPSEQDDRIRTYLCDRARGVLRKVQGVS